MNIYVDEEKCVNGHTRYESIEFESRWFARRNVNLYFE